MKNLLFIMATCCLLLMVGCEKEESEVIASAGQQEEIDTRTPPAFIALCHLKPDGSYVSMNVPENALQVHLGHGDRYADEDGDGYSWIGACSGSGDDCDDSSSNIHPGAQEYCNFGIDDDCDGLIDDQDPSTIGKLWWHLDADGDGDGDPSYFTNSCLLPAGYVPNDFDCDDSNPNISSQAEEIANDGIDQDCDGSDLVTYGPCDCFTMEELQQVYAYTPWPYGWWSDVPGSCKDAPYDQLMEVWITNVGQPAQNFNFSVQAGTINGNPFASQARFNHLTGQFDELCGGYTNAQNASNCAQILHDFIAQMRASHPSWDYCVRFP